MTDPTRPRRGDRGELVKVVQNLLNAHGYSLDVDGVFGAKTDAAVRDFQTRHALTVDGIAGPLTTAALSTPSSGAPSPAPAPTPAPRQEIDTMTPDQLKAIIRDAIREELDSIETARSVWTRHRVVKDTRDGADPDTRVTPSTLLEDKS